MFEDINWWYFALSVVVNFVFGAFWYSPLMFGKIWQKLKGVSDEDLKGGSVIMFVPILGALIVSLVFLGMIEVTGADDWFEGLMLGFLMSIPTLVVGLNNVVFGSNNELKRRFYLYLIDFSYPLIAFMLSAFVLIYAI